VILTERRAGGGHPDRAPPGCALGLANVNGISPDGRARGNGRGGPLFGYGAPTVAGIEGSVRLVGQALTTIRAGRGGRRPRGARPSRRGRDRLTSECRYEVGAGGGMFWFNRNRFVGS
jgi:hypothetical protein